MNGIESLLLIIVGFLSLATWFYFNKEVGNILAYYGYGKLDVWLQIIFLLYGLITLVTGNIMFIIWLFK